MTFTRRVMMSGVLVATGGAFGCGHHHHEERRPVAVPVYEPGYYDRGYYQGEEWYWRDRAGREFHEPREQHEQRMRNWEGRQGERTGGRDEGDRERR